MDKLKNVSTWVFDLDNTLYDSKFRLMEAMSQKIMDFIINKFGMSENDAYALRNKYWKQYGLTMNGLMIDYNINPQEYLKEIHDIDISHVPPCKTTIEQLKNINGRKLIFTNSSSDFAERMLKQLGINDQFETIFSIEDSNFIPKPKIESYHTAIKKLGFDPKTSCMFEDTAMNLEPAAQLGMTTVWIQGEQACEKGNHPYIHHKSEKLSDWLEKTFGNKD